MTTLYSETLHSGYYRSYLMRFWQDNKQGSWRVSARCVQTGSTLLFGEVESLLAFLQAKFGEQTTAKPCDNKEQTNEKA